jgi:hypothetical protein
VRVADCLRDTLALLVALFIGTGCAGPVAGLWPAPPGTPTVTIHVSVDTWHAMIALPPEDPRPPLAFEEWGYAQRGWYLEGRQGALDAVRALLWPGEGVVEVALTDRLWAERTPQPPADVFSFVLARESYQRLRAHLAATRAGPEPVAVLGSARFYPARDPYHLFHTCHQWAARALRAAGLPLVPAAALTRGALALQLARAARLAAAPAPS